METSHCFCDILPFVLGSALEGRAVKRLFFRVGPWVGGSGGVERVRISLFPSDKALGKMWSSSDFHL